MNEKFEKIIKTIIFIVILLIPIIYSFFYLKSYWDPYGNLEDIKIAIVNLDKGNETENQGKEFVKELKDSGTFNICDVNSEEAKEGLKEGTYYAVITLPEDFTDSLNSAKGEDKRISTITYTPNKQKNYLATQIINSAIKTIETNLQAKVAQNVVEGLTDNLKDVPESLKEISDGTGKILNGSESLHSGLAQIDDGTNKLKNSYEEFDNGVQSAYEGSKTLTSGNNQIDTGIGELQTGTTKLDAGIVQINEALNNADLSKLGDLTSGIEQLNAGVNGNTGLKNGVSNYVAGTEGIANGVVTLDTTLDTLISQYTSAYQNAVATANAQDQLKYATAIQTLTSVKNSINNTSNGTSLVSGAKQLTTADSAGLTAGGKLKYGVTQISNGVTQLDNATSDIQSLGSSIVELKSNLAKVQTGTSTLKEGVSKLKLGSEQASTGSETLTNGLEKLNNGSESVKVALEQLSEGTDKALDGSEQLVDGVETLKTSIDEGIVSTSKELEKLNGLSDFVENPIEFKEDSYGKIDTYGIAFTPLFISIGLWVGSLMCYVVLYYDQKNRFGILGSDAKNKQLQNIIYIGIGAVQGIITGLLLKLGLGFEVENIVAYYFVCLLIGITFMSIIQFLIRNFGDIGKFMALIILVLQLASSGGTFPVETIDKGFRMWNSILPMTYTIDLLREILVPTDANHQFMYVAILVGITICCLGITFIIDFIKNKKENKAN